MALDVRGTPEWQIRLYLEGLGGVPQPDGSVAGPGWTARLETGEHRAFGTLLPRVVISFEGETAAIAAVEKALRLRAMRAGG